METINPTQVIIIAGSNDISHEYRKVIPDENKIVNNIVNIANKAREHGTQKIFISGIMVRKAYFYKNIIGRINELLYKKCQEEGFIYLDQSDISPKHIWNDGLHLNKHGMTILKMNLSKCFYTFNPFYVILAMIMMKLYESRGPTFPP